MNVEDVARISFASWRPSQKQRKLAIGNGLLREIIINDQRVATGVAEVLAHGAARVGCDVLKRRRLCGRRCDDDRVLERVVLRELLHHLSNRALLLPDGDVDALYVLALLVDDRVDRDCSLTRLAIANDQLSLTTTNRHHGVDGLDARRERFVHRLARYDARGLEFNLSGFGGVDGTLAVDRVAESVDHAAKHGFADRYFDDAASALDDVAFLDLARLAHDGDTDVVFFKVEHHAAKAVAEFDELACECIVEAVHTGDPITSGQHCAGFCDVDLAIVLADLAL